MRRITNHAGMIATPQSAKLSEEEPSSLNDSTELVPYATAWD